ncbi:MAG: hypothetical protein OEL84_08070 [Nitrosopumilus sp.]|nr:hypothetical protein [Nitrosopumilus sp.]
MTSKSITTAVSSNGKKITGELGKGIRKLHAIYRQIKNAKTRGKLRRVPKTQSDHQNLLKSASNKKR